MAGICAGRPLSILMTADVDPVRVNSGAERLLNEHSRRLAAGGNRVTVLTRREDPELPPFEELDGVRVVRYDIRSGSQVRFFASVMREGARAYRRLAREEAFDVVNAHQPLAAAALLQGAGRRRPPMIYTFLSPWAREYVVRSRRTGEACKARYPHISGLASGFSRTAHAAARHQMERYALGCSRQILALSRFSAGQLRDFHSIPADAVRVIPGGVDLERFRPASDRAGLRRRLGLPADAPVLLTVRNLDPRMGLENLVEAMRAVARAYPEARLVIGGHGPLLPSLRVQVSALGVERNVAFAGFIPEQELPSYYAAADLFVLPTRCMEGFGLVTLEALACGTPVVGTPVGAIPEVLGPLGADLLVPGTSAGAIAEHLIRHVPGIVGDAALRERCRRYAVERYGWASIVERLEELIWETASLSPVERAAASRSAGPRLGEA